MSVRIGLLCTAMAGCVLTGCATSPERCSFKLEDGTVVVASGDVSQAATEEFKLRYALSAVSLDDDTDPQSEFLAAAKLLDRVDLGDPVVQEILGTMQFLGLGVERDVQKSAEWVRKAAEQGHATAQGELGRIYWAGRGVPRDEAEAGRWFLKAAMNGDASVCSFLGILYGEGRGGFPKDKALAAKWKVKAAHETDSMDALYELGKIYENGEGIGKDIHEAVKCYEMAFERGKLTVGEELERMYKEGREGLPKDPEKAASWRQRYVEAYNRP